MGKMFILCGLVLTFTLGAFFALIFTSNIKNNVVKLIVGLMIAFIIGYGVIYLIFLEYKCDERNYNNGVCSKCYEKLELFDIEHNRNSNNSYYYKCKNNHLVKTSNYFD